MIAQKDKTLALAGLFQAAELVRQYALTGKINEEAAHANLGSILKIDTHTITDIFGGTPALQLGLRCLVRYAEKKPSFQVHPLLRYVLPMMSISKKLLRDKMAVHQLKRRLNSARSQAAHFPIDHAYIINNFSTIYKRIILDKGYRIPVMGRIDLLQQTAVTEKIQALLLAGIRAAVLWHQVGGSRWQLFFSCKKMGQVAKIILIQHFLQSTLDVNK